MQLQNTEKQPQSVSNPWIFHSLPVENFSPTPPSHGFKGHWESDTAYLPSHLTWPINHQPQAFSHRLRWGGLCAISWKRLTPQPCQTFFLLTFQISCGFAEENLVSFQSIAILIWCCSKHFSVSCTVFCNTYDKYTHMVMFLLCKNGNWECWIISETCLFINFSFSLMTVYSIAKIAWPRPLALSISS